MDYLTTHGSITFTTTNTQQMVSISIIDDLAREDEEMLTIHLTNGPARVSLDPSQASISITDNDSKDLAYFLFRHCLFYSIWCTTWHYLLCKLMWHSLLHDTGVVIGFDPKWANFSKESSRGQFTVRVISGRLDSSVTVLLNTAKCVADSEIIHMHLIWLYHVAFNFYYLHDSSLTCRRSWFSSTARCSTGLQLYSAFDHCSIRYNQRWFGWEWRGIDGIY